MGIVNNRLSAAQYTENFADIHPPFETVDAALVEANRCLFCYDAPCTKLCPTSIDVPKFIKQISSGNVRGSAHTILSANIMGAGCSKVCPVEKLCEGACVFNLMHEPPINIARLQRYSTEKAMAARWPLFQRKASTGKRVAVVGAGPAGLSCAHVLAREGVDVTIYEREPKGGGLMTYGIAAYKVTPEFCEEEVQYILSIGGITIEYGQALGQNLTLEALQQQFDAVYLAFGVGQARRLNIPGEELEGVVDALSFIYTLRAEGYPAVPVGDKVAVIGMGMTAIDAATQARRLGASEVTLVYRRTQDEMPCTEYELDIAKLDGCQIIWLAAPKEVQGVNGKVNKLLCERMKLGAPDASGRRSPEPAGQTFLMDVDMVIKAAGQEPFGTLVSNLSLENRQGRVAVADKASTNRTGIFAGGDCVNGGREVVDAVQAGKDGAVAILTYLF